VVSMPVTLARTISKIQSIPNNTNAQLVREVHHFCLNFELDCLVEMVEVFSMYRLRIV
jgi:hypothetical protein